MLQKKPFLERYNQSNTPSKWSIQLIVDIVVMVGYRQSIGDDLLIKAANMADSKVRDLIEAGYPGVKDIKIA